MKKSKIDKEITDILNGFDGIKAAEMPPFFYTRLRANMQSNTEINTASLSFIRPAFLTISLSLFLVINIILLGLSVNNNMPNKKQSTIHGGIQSFADAYGLGESSVYE